MLKMVGFRVPGWHVTSRRGEIYCTHLKREFYQHVLTGGRVLKNRWAPDTIVINGVTWVAPIHGGIMAFVSHPPKSRPPMDV